MAIIEEVNEETNNVPDDITTILDKLSNADDKERVTKYIESLQTTILDLGGKLPDDEKTEVKDTEMEDAAPDAAADAAAADASKEETTTKDDDNAGVGGDDDIMMPPQYVSGEDYDSAANFKQQAADAKADGNNEKALEYYNQAIQAAPPSALLYANRAIVLQKLGQIKAAMKDCDLALEKNPDSAKALKTRGKLYYQQEKWELALQDLNQAQTIDFDPDLVDMLKDLTKKHIEQEKKDAAARNLEEEKLKKRAAEIKKAQQEAAEEAKREQEERAARESAAGMGGGMPGGMGGMGGMPGGMGGGMPGMGGMGGGMPGGMGGMADMMNDPELQEAMKNPKVVKALSELMEGPGGPMGLMSDPSKLQKLMADPEVGPVLQKLMGKFMGGGAGGMPGAGMGGMPGAGFGGSGTSGGGGGGGADDIPDLDDLPDLD